MTFERERENFQHEGGSISELILLKEFEGVCMYINRFARCTI